jgi:hypothetical protein
MFKRTVGISVVILTSSYFRENLSLRFPSALEFFLRALLNCLFCLTLDRVVALLNLCTIGFYLTSSL